MICSLSRTFIAQPKVWIKSFLLIKVYALHTCSRYHQVRILRFCDRRLALFLQNARLRRLVVCACFLYQNRKFSDPLFRQLPSIFPSEIVFGFASNSALASFSSIFNPFKILNFNRSIYPKHHKKRIK